MLILSIDCAGNACAASVWQDGNTLALIEERMERGQDARLVPLVLEVMAQAHADFSQLDRIAVTRGPGSFTGLRIGLATARGIGLASNKPVIGIDRFRLYHEQNKALPNDLLIVLQSKRLELFCRLYPAGKEPQEPTMLSPDEIAAVARENSSLCIAGNTGDFLCSFLPEQTLFLPLRETEVITSALLASQAALDDPATEPTPLYLRAPDVTTARTICLANEG